MSCEVTADGRIAQVVAGVRDDGEPLPGNPGDLLALRVDDFGRAKTVAPDSDAILAAIRELLSNPLEVTQSNSGTPQTVQFATPPEVTVGSLPAISGSVSVHNFPAVQVTKATPDATVAATNLSAVNAAVVIAAAALPGAQSVAFNVSAVGSGTITFQVSYDGGTTYPSSLQITEPAARTTGTTTTTTGRFVAATIAGATHYRAILTSYANSTFVVAAALSVAPVPFPNVLVQNTPSVTLAAANARVGHVAGAGVWYDDTSTALGAAATFTGSSRDLSNAAASTAFNTASSYGGEFRASAEQDVAFTLYLDVSRDGTNWRVAKVAVGAAVSGGGFFAEIIHRPSWRYARVRCVNGAAAAARTSVGTFVLGIG